MPLICFSSGATPRYRDDIVRAMAMPTGCEITFRYRLKYLGASVDADLKNNRIVSGAEVVICYVDQSDLSKPVDFIPVRYASLIEAPVIGDFVVLRMRVREFAYTRDLDIFNTELKNCSAELPKWPPVAAQYPVGSYWVSVPNYPTSSVKSTQIEHWQGTVAQLVDRTDFATSGPFFQIVRVQQVGSKAEIPMSDGEYKLASNTPYELVLDHFLPAKATGNFQLEATLFGSGIASVAGAIIQIDSSYDRHWLRFKSEEPLKPERAIITVVKKATGQEPTLQFDLPIRVAGRTRKAVLWGLLVGVLLAAPTLVTLFANPSFASRSNEWWIVMVALYLVANCSAGILAALNFRKPI